MSATRLPEALRAPVRALRSGEGRLAVLTGAGLSAAAGLPTFRGAGGFWEGRSPMELASPEAFARDPELVWRWYAARLAACLDAPPTRAHRDLAALARAVRTTVVTQNVDALHTQAGSDGVIELHGSIRRARCGACGHRVDLTEPPAGVPPCPACAERMRPDVVWFGEALDSTDLTHAEDAFAAATIALVVGTSGVVWPAAGLAHRAERSGALIVVVDPGDTMLDDLAHWRLRVGADEGVRVVREAFGFAGEGE